MIKQMQQLEADLGMALDELATVMKTLEQERAATRNKFLRKWKVDTSRCNECKAPFTLLNRRHHCRICGDVFCSLCCANRIREQAFAAVSPVLLALAHARAFPPLTLVFCRCCRGPAPKKQPPPSDQCGPVTLAATSFPSSRSATSTVNSR